MKRFLCLLAACALLAGCVEQINMVQASSAVVDLGMAAAVNDQQLRDLSRSMRAEGDAKARVAPANSPHVQRLNRIMANHASVNGVPLNYKVYLTDEVNANASADGSVRVYSGLMDLMTDDEIRYVLGHEIGHVANGDTLRATRVAYVGSAARKGLGSLNPAAGALSSSFLGDLLEATLNAQFSQQQELAADAYALNFLRANGYNTRGAITALRKMEALGGGKGGGLLSSHPAAGERAARLEGAL